MKELYNVEERIDAVAGNQEKALEEERFIKRFFQDTVRKKL